MKKTCKICEKEFESEHKQTLYCSKYCQGQSKKKPRTCTGCGSIFMSKSKQQRFCSNTCGARFNTRANRITLTCETCQKTFERTKSRIRHETVYCSRECSDGSLKPSRVTSVVIKCTNCEKEFRREQNALNADYNYCSHSCYSNFVTKMGLVRGENNPRYNSNLTQEERVMGRNFPEYTTWRNSVYERDNYTCKCCLTRGRKLHAHHILNYATHKDLRTKVTNGVTMCEECHREFHKKYGRFNNNEIQLNEFIREISQYRAEPS